MPSITITFEADMSRLTDERLVSIWYLTQAYFDATTDDAGYIEKMAGKEIITRFIKRSKVPLSSYFDQQGEGVFDDLLNENALEFIRHHQAEHLNDEARLLARTQEHLEYSTPHLADICRSCAEQALRQVKSELTQRGKQ